MRDSSIPQEPLPEEPQKMVLLAINQSYWLAEGAEFLTPMLDGSGYFPTPVTCLIFHDSFELRQYIGPERSMTEFWGINPDIVERLRRDDHLNEIFANTL